MGFFLRHYNFEYFLWGMPKFLIFLGVNSRCWVLARLISVVDVVGPMNPYQPIPFHILSFAVFQSRILIYASLNMMR